MSAEIIQQLNEILKDDQMALLYSGDFSDDVTTQIIGLSGVQFDDGSGMSKLQRKTGFLIAECFQNIVRHNESSIENGYFLTRNYKGDLHIASGNIVRKEDIENLSDKLNHLNSLSKEELKEVYVQTLSNNTLSAKGGAGLGLIEMARKTGNKLDFDFREVKDDLSYFYFQLMFDTNKSGDISTSEGHTLNASIDLRKFMLDNQLFLVYKGDVSMDTILPLLGMIENSIASMSDEMVVQKKVLLVMIEFLQNMSKHGAEIDGVKDGLIVMGQNDGVFIVGGSNLVENNNKPRLSEMLEKYATMELEDLNTTYKKVLKEGDPSNKTGSSLGLIEMARRSTVPFQFDFEKAGENHSLYNILLQI